MAASSREDMIKEFLEQGKQDRRKPGEAITGFVYEASNCRDLLLDLLDTKVWDERLEDYAMAAYTQPIRRAVRRDTFEQKDLDKYLNIDVNFEIRDASRKLTHYNIPMDNRLFLYVYIRSLPEKIREAVLEIAVLADSKLHKFMNMRKYAEANYYYDMVLHLIKLKGDEWLIQQIRSNAPFLQPYLAMIAKEDGCKERLLVVIDHSNPQIKPDIIRDGRTKGSTLHTFFDVKRSWLTPREGAGSHAKLAKMAEECLPELRERGQVSP